jgi:nucleotide-binding universal stress UspA family protein
MTKTWPPVSPWLNLPGQLGAALRIRAVTRPPEFGEEIEMAAIVENSHRDDQQAPQPLKQRVAAQGLAAACQIVVGHPAEQIVIPTEQLSATLVVVGPRGRGLMGRWLVGSVAKRSCITHRAPCWWRADSNFQ